MTLGEYVNQFARTLRELRSTKTERAVGVAGDVLAQVKRRVQTSGTNFRGVTFAPYSRLYATQRRKAGFQAAYVDFTRRGRLWNSINPFVQREGRFNTIVVVRPRDRENQQKLNKLSVLKNRGNILIPSNTELAFAIQIWRNKALDKLNRIR